MDFETLKIALENGHQFPCEYTFKFVVPQARVDEVRSLLPGARLSEKASQNGNYVSVTLRSTLASADAIVDVYRRAAAIEQLIAL